jgi:CBS domain containing-hemolysin-like protein
MPRSKEKVEPPQTSSMLQQRLFPKFRKFFSIFCKSQEPEPFNYTDEEGVIGGFNVSQHQVMNNFKKFSGRTVEEIMIPRLDIIAIKSDVGLEELSKFIIEHAHTRTLIYQDTLDNIVGFVHIKDLFKLITESKKYNLKKLMRKHIIAPHSMKLVDLLSQMRIHRTHIAIVVDEYGGTDGLVTIEDIIEEIVGPIDDEHDDVAPINGYKIIKPGLIISSARVEIEELEQITSVKLKHVNDEFNTIGGMVMAKVGHIPEKGQVVSVSDDITIEILDSTPKTLKQLKIIYNAKNQPPNSDS